MLRPSFSHERCRHFVGLTTHLDPGNTDRVFAAIDAVGLTRLDFIELDERPGQYDPRYNDHGWYTALRTLRNDPDSELFDRLDDNMRSLEDPHIRVIVDFVDIGNDHTDALQWNGSNAVGGWAAICYEPGDQAGIHFAVPYGTSREEARQALLDMIHPGVYRLVGE